MPSGSAQDPWRTVEARLPRLGTDCRSLSAASGAAWRSRESLAGISPEPPGSHRGLRLLHRADGDVAVALLLLRHRARPTDDPARHPMAGWVIQQLREAFPQAAPYRYVILDRDSKFDHEALMFCGRQVWSRNGRASS